MAHDASAVGFATTPLSEGWTFKQGDISSTNEYAAANNLPTEIHRDLLKHGRIPNPFEDLNELSVRWVGDECWTYRTTFDAPSDHGKPGVFTALRFEGLDTFACVYLNKQELFKSDNMFVEHRLNVTERLKARDNVLEIVFESARKKGLELVEQHKEHRFIVHQTEISRGPIRKTQADWGWDWGPILMACGPCKPISIETYSALLKDLHVLYDLAEGLKSVKVRASVAIQGEVGAVSFRIIDATSKELLATREVVVPEAQIHGTLEAEIVLDKVELWWPRGYHSYGTQSLYIVEAIAYRERNTQSPSESSLYTIERRIGFRKTELIKAPDAHGTSFYLRINNVDIFCGGSCWIPADSLLTRLMPRDYYNWVRLAAEGNQTMLRVWGGGIYEADAFYDAADELGVLVWQDFMFACASYPTYASYLSSVELEARQNVRRIRHHPSVVIWAGNNEDYQLVERYGLQYDVDDKDPDSWLKSDFPARYIYEHLLPHVLLEESPNVPYHPSSPFGDGNSTVLKVDPTIGDVHQWNVWHGTMESYQRLPDMGGRFVSEFGMEAYPHVSTIERCITKEEDRYPGSMMMDFRNKAIGHERRLLNYVAENFKLKYDLDNYTHLTQVMQADAMFCAYKSWRRQWGSQGDRKCGGVLVWQLNDCWPTISWAVVDYYMVPKPAYYAIKRAMAPIVVNVVRNFESWTAGPAGDLWQRDTGHIDVLARQRNVKYDVWVANSTAKQIQGQIIVSYISISTGDTIRSPVKRSVLIGGNGTTEILGESLSDIDEKSPFVIYVELLIEGTLIATDVSWPDPVKYLSFPNRGLKVKYSDDKTVATISAEKPVKGFVFSERQGISLSDNGFDLVPGKTKEVVVKGCAASDLSWKYVDM
ncbi:hypothetical protein ACN47E_009242 [Coniothyrium glycines]